MHQAWLINLPTQPKSHINKSEGCRGGWGQQRTKGWGNPKQGGEQGRNPEAQEQPQSLHHKTVPATRHKAQKQKQHWAGAGFNCSILGRDQPLSQHRTGKGERDGPQLLPICTPKSEFPRSSHKTSQVGSGSSISNQASPAPELTESWSIPSWIQLPALPEPPAIPPEPFLGSSQCPPPSACSHSSIPLHRVLSAVKFLWWHHHH